VTRLERGFYDRPVLEVARDLVGCVVRHGPTAGVIVETEAYHHSEPACHAYVGLTPRTKTLYGPPGVAYVYRSYGIHALLNAVCEPEGEGAAVLVRALEPLDGIAAMRARRGAHLRLEDLCSGPGKLTQALGIGLELNGTSLLDGPVAFEAPVRARPAIEVTVGPRVGITKAAELPWRFCALGSRHVSRPWPPGHRASLAAA
jgi:DNA-3-methyladenine glycosylase